MSIRSLRRIGGLHDVRRCRAVVIGRRFLQNGRAVLVHEGDRILVHGRRIGRRVGGIASYIGNFRRPTCEGVSILNRCSLGGRLASIGRRLAIGHRLALQLRTVIVQEGDRVFVHRGAVGRLVGGVAGDRHDFRRPACEGVSILNRCSLGGRLARVGRRRAIGHFPALQLRAVIVHEPDSIGGRRIQYLLPQDIGGEPVAGNSDGLPFARIDHGCMEGTIILLMKIDYFIGVLRVRQFQSEFHFVI